MLSFPYGQLPERGTKAALSRFSGSLHQRPFVPVRIQNGAGRYWNVTHAVVDTGSDDSVFPYEIATLLAINLGEEEFRVRWRGTAYPLRFGVAQFELESLDEFCIWSATIGFSPAPIPYPILGQAGCLQYFDVTFRGADRVVDFEPNGTFPGEAHLAVQP